MTKKIATVALLRAATLGMAVAAAAGCQQGDRTDRGTLGDRMRETGEEMRDEAGDAAEEAGDELDDAS